METALERQIGSAERIDGPFESAEDEIAFKLPYGSYDYKISLSDDDLDFLLSRGFAKIVGEESIKGLFFDGEVDLGSDLPLFVDSGPVRTQPTSPRGTSHEVRMDVHTATMSMANEHRGVLSVEKGILGSWLMLDYLQQPPLRDKLAE